MSNREPFVLVDIGARGGAHPRWQALQGHLLEVLFEPEPLARQALQEAGGGGRRVLDCAVAGNRGTRDFHVLEWAAGSSLLEPDPAICGRYPYIGDYIRIQKTLQVETRTLDEALEGEGLPAVDFLKLDTQGSELEILMAAPRTVSSALGMEIEAEFIAQYRGQPLWAEVHAFMSGQGFELMDLRRQYWKRKVALEHPAPGRGQIVFADALYMKSPERLLEEGGDERLFRAVEMYAVYGKRDLAWTLWEAAAESGAWTEVMREEARTFLEDHGRGRCPSFPGQHRLVRFLRRLAERLSPCDWAELDSDF